MSPWPTGPCLCLSSSPVRLSPDPGPLISQWAQCQGPRLSPRAARAEPPNLYLQGASALFDMIEYYESATHLNISFNKHIGTRGWQAAAHMMRKVGASRLPGRGSSGSWHGEALSQGTARRL